METETLSAQHVGRIVRVRQRQFLVDEVEPGKTASTTIARLSCIDPDNLGRPLEVIWEDELDAEIPKVETWDQLGGSGFDPPDRFSAYYHTLRWNRVTASRTDLLQARSGRGSPSSIISSSRCGWPSACRGSTCSSRTASGWARRSRPG